MYIVEPNLSSIELAIIKCANPTVDSSNLALLPAEYARKMFFTELNVRDLYLEAFDKILLKAEGRIPLQGDQEQTMITTLLNLADSKEFGKAFYELYSIGPGTWSESRPEESDILKLLWARGILLRAVNYLYPSIVFHLMYRSGHKESEVSPTYLKQVALILNPLIMVFDLGPRGK